VGWSEVNLSLLERNECDGRELGWRLGRNEGVDEMKMKVKVKRNVK